MSTEIPLARKDSEVIQILATEHWSLLATRALTYQESLGRVNMFLAVLSGAVIALALIAQADHFGPTFISVAIFMLSVVFFVGLLTVRRLLMLNRDDYMWVVAMNRVRHAYLDLHPELVSNFTTGSHDDLGGVLQTLGIDAFGGTRIGSLFHSLVTLPGMLGVIVASVGGAIGALIASGFGASPLVVLMVGLVFFLAALAVVAIWGRSSVRQPSSGLQPRFPSTQSERERT